MQPISKSTENFRKALRISNEITLQQGATYVGSEHFVYAFLRMPTCSAYKVLTARGISSSVYDARFFDSIDKKSRQEGLTRRTQLIYDRAVQLAEERGMLAGTAHFLYALLEIPDCWAVKFLQQVTDVSLLREATRMEIERAFASGEEREQPVDEKTAFGQAFEGLEDTGARTATMESGTDVYKRRTSKRSATMDKLSAYGLDMTERAKRGKLDPVIGRNTEIEKVIQILSRRTKNNPVLVGEPGVGKSAIIEGLCQLIVSENVPPQLLNKKVLSVDLPGMIAGARYRGDFEEKLKDLIGITMQDGDIILFIDEIHTLVGAGASSDNSMDAGNILKPLLARGDLQLIGATTVEEYRKYIEKDSALERRFTPVNVAEPSEADAIEILKGLRPKYEEHHDIVILDEAIETAVKLSSRYITDRFLPDKAIDLIDEASARVRILENGGVELRELEQDILRFEEERRMQESRREYALATKALEQKQLAQEKWHALKQAQSPMVLPDGRLALGREQVAGIISARIRIPLTKITQEEGEKLLRLEEELHRRIIGQNEAVTAVAKAIRRARAGLKDPSRPIGSFIFVGPTGVGKTDLCKALAESMFGSEEQMIRLDMSEYMEKQAVSKIIGAPPGYVGFEEMGSGQLTDKVRSKPYSVILFDEIEKAHPDIFNLLLQILDDGRLTDSKGRTVSFKNAVIILTSNVGATVVESERTGVYGFGSGEMRSEEQEHDALKERVNKTLKEKFRPEFLNRLDDIIVFHSLTQEDCQQIAKKMLEGLAKRLLEQRGIMLTVTASALEALVKDGYDSQYGARPLKRTIRRNVEDKLSEEILIGKFQNGDKITVEYQYGEYVFIKE